jgi:uncharacterized membrane protein YcaP (DUF421 family)
MEMSWITTSLTNLLMVIVSTVGIYIALISYTRLAGLRSFSKMSSFDFAVTVAIGSIIASTVLTENPPLLQATVGLGALYAVQIGVAKLRRGSAIMSKLVDNQPILLMKGSEVMDKNLQRASVTHADLRAKLREANVTKVSQVKAVVMEATGDISVLHHSDGQHHVDDKLLENVQGW